MTVGSVIGPKVARRSVRAFGIFAEWRRFQGRSPPCVDEQSDALRVGYLVEFLTDNATHSEAEYLICAVKALFPKLSNRIG